MFYLAGWYTTMNGTIIIHFTPSYKFPEGNFVLFYYDNTGDVRHKKHVDNIISVVVHHKNWWHLMFYNNANYILYWFH